MTPRPLRELIDAGVDGIFTDRIDTLKDVLIRRELWTDHRSRGHD